MTQAPAGEPLTGPEPLEPAKRLTTTRIVMLIVAAAAPLGAIVGNVPVGLIRGNGPGLPGSYLIAGAVLLCFAVGFAALIPRIEGGGAFYTYIGRIFGRRMGMASACVALVSYFAITMQLASGTGYYIDLFLGQAGVHAGWVTWSAVSVTIIAVLGTFGADFNARVLVIFVSAEFIMLGVMDALVGADRGAAALPLQSLEPSTVFATGFGVAAMVAFTSFIGFEQAAIYWREARDPHRSVPRAMMLAVALIAIFYFVTSWFVVGGLGFDQARAKATGLEGETVFSVIGRYGGEALTTLFGVAFLTSLTACFIALHSASSRYAFILGEERVLPRGLAVLSGRRAPRNASVLITVCTVLVLAAFAISGADPYLLVGAVCAAVGTLGVVALQAITCAGIIVHFRRERDPRIVTTLIAPAIGLVGLVATFVLMLTNYSLLAGSDAWYAYAIPFTLVIAFITGLTLANRSASSVETAP